MFLKKFMLFLINQGCLLFTPLKYIDIENPMCASIAYKIIYIFSQVQIFISKITKRMLPVICLFSSSVSTILHKYKLITKNEVVCSIEFYKSNKLIIRKSISHDDLLKHITVEKSFLAVLENKIPDACNLIVYSDHSQSNQELHNTQQINKICYNELPQDLEYVLSDIRFISLLLTYKSQEYNIELQNVHFNYYIVNNKIDKNFIKYYWNHIINNSDDKLDEYMLTLCDQDVNIKMLEQSDVIIIYKDSYEIVKEKEI